MSTEHDFSTLGARVDYAVSRSGRPVSEIAAALGISAQAIYQWKDGQTANIKNALLFRLADITGCDARWIATGEGAPEAPPYTNDPRIFHIMKVMQALPEYAIDDAVREVDSVAELVAKAEAASRRAS